MNYGVGCRLSPNPMLLWLWHKSAAPAPVRPLAWELPYAAGTALKRQKKKIKWQFPGKQVSFLPFSTYVSVAGTSKTLQGALLHSQEVLGGSVGQELGCVSGRYLVASGCSRGRNFQGRGRERQGTGALGRTVLRTAGVQGMHTLRSEEDSSWVEFD